MLSVSLKYLHWSWYCNIKVLPGAILQDIVRRDPEEAAQSTPAAEPAAAAPQQEAPSEAEAHQPKASSGVAGEVPAGHSGAEQGQPPLFLPPVSGSGAPQAHSGLPAASSVPFQVAPVGMQPGFGPRMLPPHGRPLRPMPFIGMLPMRPGEASRGRGCQSAAAWKCHADVSWAEHQAYWTLCEALVAIATTSNMCSQTD